ncbi:MAG: tetratricopeptide repeat protein [bacterium]
MQIKKKLTRKQFLAQDDEVTSFMKTATDWVKKNANLIVFGVIGIGVVVAAVWGFRYKKESDFKNSSRLLSEARLNYYAKVEGESAAGNPLESQKSFKDKKEKYAAAISSLDQLLQLYPSQPGAEDALFLKAEAYYQQEEYDKAILIYKEYLEKYKSKGAYNAQALTSIGYAYEAKDDFKEAAGAFKKVVDDYQDYLLRDSVFMELGRCYEQMKEWEKAKDAFQKVVMNFPDSPLLKDAQSKLDAIGQPPATSAGGAEKTPEADNTASKNDQAPEESSNQPAADTAPVQQQGQSQEHDQGGNLSDSH